MNIRTIVKIFYFDYLSDSNYTRMLRAILKSRTRQAGYSWRSQEEHISDILEWIPSHGRAKAGQPARTYIQQLCADTRYGLEDLPEVMDDRDGWRERVKEIPAGGAT